MKAKKSYGQHFLTSEIIAQRIAESLQLRHLYGKVLEIGPGQGMLTKHLLDIFDDLTVVEADRDMVTHVEKHFPELEGKVISGDFLKLKLEDVFGAESFAIIGNFPYNISSQILFRMLDYREQVPELVGMFQLEMAERVVSPPGSKTYGVISVLIQAYYEGKVLFRVKPGSFNPPPRVESAVIQLVRKENQDLGCDAKLFKRVVKQSFSQRRKMLRNTMKAFIKGDELLQDDFFRERPEQLSLADFVKLTNWIEERIEKE